MTNVCSTTKQDNCNLNGKIPCKQEAQWMKWSQIETLEEYLYACHTAELQQVTDWTIGDICTEVDKH